MTELKKSLPLAALLLLTFLLVALPFTPGWRRNMLSLQAMRAILEGKASARTYARLGASAHPQKEWFQALIAARLGNTALQRWHWLAYLRSGAAYAPALVNSAAPGDLSLALAAAQSHPARPEAWFWLAEVLSEAGFDDQAIPAYQRALDLRPNDPLPWCRLGGLLRPYDVLAARDALLQCCVLGDPGSNGCVNAGNIEAERGNYAAAIRYYRLSHWSEAWRRADELEAAGY